MQAGFFALFVLAPPLNFFRLDLTLGHFILFGWDWTLGLDGFVAGKDSAAVAAWHLFARGLLPILLMVGGVLWVSFKWGRLYCGWLCPHFSVVETINRLMLKTFGKQSIWDKQPQIWRTGNGKIGVPDPRWWLVLLPAVAGFAFLWALVALTYLLPPMTIYHNLLTGQLTRAQGIFLGVGTSLLTIEFMFARHLFCRYACAAGLFQSLAWMANRKAMVVSFKRESAAGCSGCQSGCEDVCPMRLKPRQVKRMMFACVQCGQCLDRCETQQAPTGKVILLQWEKGNRASQEAAFDARAAQGKPVLDHVHQPERLKD
ncbi:4Fe-4S binding protein [Leeia oryzae]|uniref:4Fe-4S binding protein n=1 Tax=Leeia oryzae TaxID=356662 RepID=UPI00036A75C4|nr:4Fe-4S binding protein [Leeia oryzae]